MHARYRLGNEYFVSLQGFNLTSSVISGGSGCSGARDSSHLQCLHRVHRELAHIRVSSWSQSKTRHNLSQFFFRILGVNMFAGKFGRCVALPTGDILPMRVGPNETEDFKESLLPTNQSLSEQCSPGNILLAQYFRGEVRLSEDNLTAILPAVKNKVECVQCANM